MQLIHTRGRRLVGATACVFALGLAACGGSSSKSASATATTSGAGTSATATATTPTTSASTNGSSNSTGGASFDACSLLSAAQLSTLAGHPYSDPTTQTIAHGQDECVYKNSAPSINLVTIVYQSDSGVSFDSLSSIQTGAGGVTNISGVGDKAIAGPIQLDIQVGDRIVAVEGAGNGGNSTESVAIGKALVAALG